MSVIMDAVDTNTLCNYGCCGDKQDMDTDKRNKMWQVVGLD